MGRDEGRWAGYGCVCAIRTMFERVVTGTGVMSMTRLGTTRKGAGTCCGTGWQRCACAVVLCSVG